MRPYEQRKTLVFRDAQPRAITVDQFCRAYSLGRSKFYLLVRDQKIKTLKVGSKTLIATDEAERWFRSLYS